MSRVGEPDELFQLVPARVLKLAIVVFIIPEKIVGRI
jgi:hypothetical protein